MPFSAFLYPWKFRTPHEPSMSTWYIYNYVTSSAGTHVVELDGRRLRPALNADRHAFGYENSSGLRRLESRSNAYVKNVSYPV